MRKPNLVQREDWLAARRQLLAREKELTRATAELDAARRNLPMVRVDTSYHFDTEQGSKSLIDLFGDHSQLIVYHFMFGKDWSEGCPSCSFWADNFNGIASHLSARDTAFVCASTAPLQQLLAYRKRMGWQFDWVSSGRSEFNADFGVTFADGDPGPTNGYNYKDSQESTPGEEMPGVSVFVRLADGGVAHSYSAYARGLDRFNGAYQLLDLTPKGRDEAGLPFTQAWVKRHDRYD